MQSLDEPQSPAPADPPEALGQGASAPATPEAPGRGPVVLEKSGRPSPTRRPGHPRGGRGERGLWKTLDARLVPWLAHPAPGAVLLAVAGILMWLGALGALSWPMERAWFYTPLRLPEVAQVAALLMGLGLLAALGRGLGQGAEGVAGGSPRPGSRFLGAGIWAMVAGALLVMGQWFYQHQLPPPSTLTIAAGQTQEAWTTPSGGKSVAMMLPLRATLEDFQTSPQVQARVRFARPGQTAVTPVVLRPGEPLDVGGTLFTLAGVAPEQGTLRALLASGESKSLKATAVVGQKVRLMAEGPSYEVLDLATNYGQAMGPAVQLRAEDRTTFWVFAPHKPQGPNAPTLDLGHGMHVESMDQVASAVFRIAPAQPLWPWGVGLGLMVAGVVLHALSLARAGGKTGRAHAARAGLGVAGAAAVLAALALQPFAGSQAWQSALADVAPWMLAQILLLGLAVGAALAACLLLDSSAGGAEEAGAAPLRPGAATALGLAVLAKAMGLAGFLRVPAGGTSWALPLVSGEGGAEQAVAWRLVDGTGQAVVHMAAVANGAALDVFQGALWLVALSGAAVALAHAVPALGRHATKAWAGLLAGSLTALGALFTAAQGAALPDAQAYVRVAERLLAARELPAQLATRGGFEVSGPVQADWNYIYPWLWALGAMAAVSFWGLWSSRKSVSWSRGALAEQAPSLALRALALGWVAWTLGGIVRWHTMATPATGSPGEWVFVGALSLGTAAVMWLWPTRQAQARPGRLASILRPLLPAWVLGMLAMAWALGFGFGMVPGSLFGAF